MGTNRENNKNNKCNKRANGNDTGADTDVQGISGGNSSIEKAIESQNAQKQNTSANNQIDNTLSNLTNEVGELNIIKESMNSFNIPRDEEFFYARKVKPLVDSVYFLSLSSSAIANTAQLMQNNAYKKKKEIRHALDLTHEMNKEIDEIFEVLTKRVDIFTDGINEAIKISGKDFGVWDE